MIVAVAIPDERLSRNTTIINHNYKGGEKTKSEWEELESLSKDELIIELVKERYMRRETNRDLRAIIDWQYPVEKEHSYIVDEDDDSSPGYRTSDEWAKKIIAYAAKKHDGEDFDYTDSYDYGLSWDQAPDIFEEMVGEGKIDWPSDDPRSKRFSGIAGYYADEVAAMDPEEREERICEERRRSE